MAELLIYVPHQGHATQSELLDKAGLGRMKSTVDFPGPTPAMREVTTGPAKMPGYVLGYSTPLAGLNDLASIAYQPDRQDWTPVNAENPAGPWFGRQHGQTTNPVALMRYNRLPTAGVWLDDGQEWQLPIVKKLPREIHFVGGRITETIRKQYDAHFQAGSALWDKFTDLERGTVDPTEIVPAWNFVSDSLAMTYAICPELIEYLGLLRDHQTVVAAAGISLEYPLILEWLRQKKTLQPAMAC